MSTHPRLPQESFLNPLEPTKGHQLLATNTADIMLTVNLLAAIAFEIVLPPEIVHLTLNLLLVAELRRPLHLVLHHADARLPGPTSPVVRPLAIGIQICLADLVAVHLMVQILLAGRSLLVAHNMEIATIIVTEPQTVIGSLPHMDMNPFRHGRLVTVRSLFDFAAAPGHTEIVPLPDPTSD